MASPDSASPTLAGRGSIARGWRRAPAAAFVVLLAATASACSKPEPAPPTIKTPGVAAMVTGMGLPLCDSTLTQGVKLVMRIYVLTSFDKLLRANPATKPLYYHATPTAPETTAEQVQYDFAPNGTTNATSTDATVLANLYHSDLLSTGLNGPALVEYRVILENGAAPPPPTLGQNMQFYSEPGSKAIAIRGIAVNPADPYDFVCSNNVIDENNVSNTTTHAIADFFVKLRPAASSTKYDAFNVVIVPKTGNTDTPIMIDPKIRNNG